MIIILNFIIVIDYSAHNINFEVLIVIVIEHVPKKRKFCYREQLQTTGSLTHSDQ